jgi:hypothetical protein
MMLPGPKSLAYRIHTLFTYNVGELGNASPDCSHGRLRTGAYWAEQRPWGPVIRSYHLVNDTVVLSLFCTRVYANEGILTRPLLLLPPATRL